jgi:NADPH:quinone reductase-like Zn-dependent oxidoreductase
MYAIRLANLAGATVIATASKINHYSLKSLGAMYAFNYKDADIVDQIQNVSNGGVEFGIDCVSVPETVGQASKAFTSNGKVGLILPVDKSKWGDHLEHRNILMYHLLRQNALISRYTIFNHELFLGAKMQGSQEDRAFAIKFYKVIGDLVASGKLMPNPIKKYSKGLARIIRGFEEMEAGKVEFPRK